MIFLGRNSSFLWVVIWFLFSNFLWSLYFTLQGCLKINSNRQLSSCFSHVGKTIVFRSFPLKPAKSTNREIEMSWKVHKLNNVAIKNWKYVLLSAHTAPTKNVLPLITWIAACNIFKRLFSFLRFAFKELIFIITVVITSQFDRPKNWHPKLRFQRLWKLVQGFGNKSVE